MAVSVGEGLVGEGLARIAEAVRGRLQEPDDAPAWASGPARRPARPDVRALVVGDRLARLLAPEWVQVGAGEPADLCLVEVRHARADELPEGVGGEDGPPLVIWSTVGGPPTDRTTRELVRRAVVVFVAEEARLEQWRELAPDARLLPPAGSTRVTPHGPARAGAHLVADGAVPPELAGTVATVVSPALRVLEEGVVVHRRSARGVLPRALAVRSAREVDDGLAAAGVVVDGLRSSPGDTWTLLEAASRQTSVVAPEGWPVPDELPVGRGGDKRTLRAAVVARVEQAELRDREARRLHRGLVAHHGASDRVDRILAAVRGPDAEPASDAVARRTVSAIVPTYREHQIDNVLASVGRQRHRALELVLVLHGLAIDHAELRARARDAGVPDLTVVDAPETHTLGACMNLGLDAASGDYVAKMDDDNHYGSHYLTDLLASFDTTGAGVVGKWAHYVWLRSSGAVVLRYPDREHSFERRIQGGSMLFEGDVVRRLRFSDVPRAVDSDILDRAIAEGVGIWSADRFNYVSIRDVDRSSHTWTVADETFWTASGRVAFYGDPRPHVEV